MNVTAIASPLNRIVRNGTLLFLACAVLLFSLVAGLPTAEAGQEVMVDGVMHIRNGAEPSAA